jgi:hypothetical protein
VQCCGSTEGVDPSFWHSDIGIDFALANSQSEGAYRDSRTPNATELNTTTTPRTMKYTEGLYPNAFWLAAAAAETALLNDSPVPIAVMYERGNCPTYGQNTKFDKQSALAAIQEPMYNITDLSAPNRS